MPKDDSFSGYVFPNQLKKEVEALISDSNKPKEFFEYIEIYISRALASRLNEVNINSNENKKLIKNTIKHGKGFLNGLVQARSLPKVSNLFNVALDNVLFDQYILEQYKNHIEIVYTEKEKTMSQQEIYDELMKQTEVDDDVSMLNSLMTMLSEDDKKHLNMRIENYKNEMRGLLFRELLPSMIEEIKKLYKEHGLRKGPNFDHVTLDFIKRIGIAFVGNYQGKYKVSASVGSKFRKLIELILQETGTDIGSDMIEKRIKSLKKNYFNKYQGGNN